MMNENVKLITIFTEAALEVRLIKDLEDLGVTGYTITNARGKGAGGLRSASWEANANIRVETICVASAVEKITEHLQNEYYDHYSMVSFVSDIEVLRPQKFRSRQ